MFLVFRIRGFFFPNIFCCFFLLWILMGTLSVNRFQSNLCYILYDIRLSSTFLWTFFFNVVFCVCSLLIFSLSIRCQYYMNYWTIVDKIDPTSEYVEMVKKKYIINYTGLHIFVKCDQKNLFNRKKIVLMNRDEDPPFFNLKVRRMANDEIYAGKLFTRSVCCFGSIDNSFFFVSQKLDLNIIYSICFWQ